MKVVSLVKKVRFFTQTAAKRQTKKSKKHSKSDKATVSIVRNNQKLGWASQEVELPGLTNVGRFINIREQMGPSLGGYPGWCSPHHRNPNALTFEDREPIKTLWAEDDARTATWR